MFWSLTIIVSLCLIYAPITALKNDPHIWTKFENILYACSRHLLWGILLAWVTYACEYGYGGKSNGQKERKGIRKEGIRKEKKELGREEGIKRELEGIRKEGIRKGEIRKDGVVGSLRKEFKERIRERT